jgi:N-acetylglucosaminyldiphosphoundecaprenol N-acetyl-beta-D-mannosaminyltransferase
MLHALGVMVVSSLLLSAAIYRFERWRLARPGGPYAPVDFTGVIVLVCTAAGWILWSRTANPADANKLMWLWMSAMFVFIVGAITDTPRPVRGLRPLATVIAAVMLYQADIAIHTIKLPFSDSFVALGPYSIIVSIVWLGICGPIFSRVGSIPRLSLGITAQTCLTFLAIGLLLPAHATPVSLMVAASIAIICLAQLPYTRYLIYGNATAGAYMFGVIIGAIAIEGALKHTAFLVALLPMLAVSVPLFAMAYTAATDWIRGKRRDFWRHTHYHLHEILMQQGYSHRQVGIVLLLGHAIVCTHAVILATLINISYIVKLIVLAEGLVVGLVVAYLALRLMKPANPPTPRDDYDLLGVRIHRVTMAEAMARVRQFIELGTPHIIVTTDAAGIIRANKDPETREIINTADLVTADGAGVVLSARLLNLGIHTRVAGCDMVSEICKVAADMNRSVYLLGAAPGVAEKAAQNLVRQVPGLRIAGVHDGYFTPEQERSIIAEIHDARPAALFVALGAPRQEKWIMQHMEDLDVPVCIGIGGSFDVISGLKPRAPLWMQRCGLEWLHRAIREPSRIPRLTALPIIVWLTINELFKAPGSPQSDPNSDTEASREKFR